MYYAILILFGFLASGGKSLATETNKPHARLFEGIPPAYEETVLRLMIGEANIYIIELDLPETRPLTARALRERFVAPPRVAESFGALGSMQSSNFSYSFGRGKRLSYITRLPKDTSNRPLYERMKPWAIAPELVDTNSAYMIATQYLARAFVDLTSIKNATVLAAPRKVLDMTTAIYTVAWRRGDNILAEVTVDMRDRELWSLRVEDPACSLRHPLAVPSLPDSLQEKSRGQSPHN